MFYFYEPQAFNIVTCEPPKMAKKKKTGGFFHLRKMTCFPFIPKNFMDADMMRSLSCFLQWVAFSSARENAAMVKEVPILRNVQWFQNAAMTKGKKGGAASVSFSLAFDRRLEITVKKALFDADGLEFIHEYIISLYGTNALRHLCPNFCYMFAIYQSKKVVRLAMEKVPGPQITEYLQQVNPTAFSVEAMGRFLKIWVQVVLGLEIAQETLFFTHFDLHGQNVMVRPVEPPTPYLEYPIMDKVYRLENVDHVATVIDFGHSTIRYDRGFIGQVKDGFPQYGMFPFYVPGADLFKLMAYLWMNNYHGKNFHKDTMGHRLGLFLQYCLEKFYLVQMVDPKRPHYIPLSTIRDSFYNGTGLPSAFYSPYDMLRFLEGRQQEILAILGVPRYPWTVTALSPVFTLYKTLRYRKKETYQCYQDLFCSPIQAMPRNLFHLTTRNTNPGISQTELNLLFTKKVPLLKKSNLAEMERFLEPKDLWARFNAYVEYEMTEIRTRGTVFAQDMTPFFYFYRAHVCVLGYKSFFTPQHK